ncbi:MAG: zf-TFIIB domain-containing protein [Planctomycetota bacterium]
MNCSNCGGPLKANGLHEALSCPYCATRQLLATVATDGPDGLALGGMPTDAPCPSGCGTLTGGMIDGLPVRGCETCGGFALDRGAFAQLVYGRRAGFDRGDVTPRPLDPETLREERRCPDCGDRFETHPYYGPGNAVIDNCHTCGLTWLDRGELAVIEAAPGRR